LAEHEPPDGSDSEPGGGFGIGSFLSTAPRAIGSITALIGAVTGLLIALNKVGILGGDGGTDTTTTTTEMTGRLFSEVTQPMGQVYFDGETMYVKAAIARHPFKALANQKDALQDVKVSARVKWVSGSNGYGVGFICRYESNANYYLLAVLTGGRYNIVRYRDGKLISLSHGIQENSAVDDDVNDITARCVGDNPTRLTLQANGVTLAALDDPDGIESGNVGVRLGSNESFVTLRFDDFVLKYF
jgi:hypothetical protein